MPLFQTGDTVARFADPSSPFTLTRLPVPPLSVPIGTSLLGASWGGLVSLSSAPQHVATPRRQAAKATRRSGTTRCLAATVGLPTAPAAPRRRWFPITPVGADALRSYLLRPPIEQRSGCPVRHPSGSVDMSPVPTPLHHPDRRSPRPKPLRRALDPVCALRNDLHHARHKTPGQAVFSRTQGCPPTFFGCPLFLRFVHCLAVFVHNATSDVHRVVDKLSTCCSDGILRDSRHGNPLATVGAAPAVRHTQMTWVSTPIQRHHLAPQPTSSRSSTRRCAMACRSKASPPRSTTS